jgi:hypothetical protein
VLGTVYIWNATLVFVMIYIGAGGWFYLQPKEADSRALEVRSRRATQARAFGVVPAAPGRTATGEGSGQSGRVPA